ncbi:3574_t:CDS:2 [Cetraspora pellucida]|uniref:3574_t:CDS:1 n=1 Tax=Cetraspora pellucida TaxID=1433469 RepID=A0A9N9EVG9_9GLOM|nr:3574_t:CDS:2 [Cetraspora pellucida]
MKVAFSEVNLGYYQKILVTSCNQHFGRWPKLSLEKAYEPAYAEA